MNRTLLTAILLVLLLTGAACSTRPKERMIANDPRGTAVLEYARETEGGDNAREEIQLRSRGQIRRVYGPARAGVTATLHTVAWGPDSVYILRCSATAEPLFAGWRLSSLTDLPQYAAVRSVYQSLPAMLRAQNFAQLCAAPPKPVPPAGPGQPAVIPSKLLRDD